MTREEAIHILDPETTGEALAEIEYYRGFTGKTAAVQAVSDACILAVAALREQEQRRWIPVTERLPEPETEVLVLSRSRCHDGRIRTRVSQSRMYLINGRPVWTLIPGWTQTHWMPLPEMPKEVTEGTE